MNSVKKCIFSVAFTFMLMIYSWLTLQNFDLSMTGTELKVTRGDQTTDIKTLLHFVNVSLETSVDHGLINK